MAVGMFTVTHMAIANINVPATRCGFPSLALACAPSFMIYDAFFPHTAINSARVTLSLLASEAGSFCLKLPISLALRTPSLSRSAALNCSVHCFSSMGAAFWGLQGKWGGRRHKKQRDDFGHWDALVYCVPPINSRQTDQASVPFPWSHD